MLGPLKKYKMLGVFPWALLMHILLVICDSIWMALVIDNQQAYVKMRLRSFLILLIDDGIKINDPTQGYYRMKYLSSLSDLNKKINENNKFYDGISKVNFIDSEVTYI